MQESAVFIEAKLRPRRLRKPKVESEYAKTTTTIQYRQTTTKTAIELRRWGLNRKCLFGWIHNETFEFHICIVSQVNAIFSHKKKRVCFIITPDNNM